MNDPQTMLDFRLPTVLQDVQKTTRDFAKQVIRPAEITIDQIENPEEAYTSDVFKSVMKEIYQAGYHKNNLPESMGGSGLGPLGRMVVMEELAVGGAGLASHILVAPIGAGPLAMGMSQRHSAYKDYLEAFLEDKEGIHSGCWGITEAELGSDLTFQPEEARWKTNAMIQEKKDEYVISGTKSSFVSNGWLGDMILLTCGTDPKKNLWGGGSWLLIPGDLPGISRGKPMNKLGLRALNQAEIFFDNVHVPKEFMMTPDIRPGGGKVSSGNARPSQRNTPDSGMTVIGVLALGTARASYEEALAYAKTRRQGGKPIIEHQNIAMKLFKAFRIIEAARALIWKATLDNTALNGSAARGFACDMAVEVTADMIQVFGGYGISKEYPVEKFYRDAKLLQIMHGTVDVMYIASASSL